MGSSLAVGAAEKIQDIRSQNTSSTGQNDYLNAMSQALPSISDLDMADKIELFRHMRGSFLDKVREIQSRPRKSGRSMPPVRETDIDDLLYAQIEVDQLILDFRTVQDNGPLSVADLTKGVEYLFSKYDTDGMFSAFAVSKRNGPVLFLLLFPYIIPFFAILSYILI